MLWFSDSLLFAEFAQYQDMTGISGASSADVTWAAQHPSGRRAALRTTRGLGIVAVQPPPALDYIETVIFGGWIRFSNAGSATETLAYTRNVSLDTQVLVEMVSSSTGVSLQFSARSKLLVTPELEKDVWHFLEIRIRHHTTDGEIEVRLHGGRLAMVTSVRTDRYALAGSPVHGMVWPEAATTFNNDFADFYICDELVGDDPFYTMLGPIEYLPVVAETDEEVEWSYSPEPDRLIILGGQSNMTGRGTASRPTATTKVKYWDEFFGGVGQVQPGANTSGMMAVPPSSDGWWGPEVRFCERVDAATAPGHRTLLVKAARDASVVYPLDIAGYSWFKDFTHDLTDRSGSPSDNCLVNYVRNLVNAELAGNWNALTDVTLVWYQGESDASFIEGASNWTYYFTELLNYLKASLNPGGPLDIKLILVRIHKDGIFSFNETVHAQQTDYAEADVLISVDDLELDAGTHLSPDASDTLGDRIFDAWVRLGRSSASLLRDFQPPGAVGEGIETGSAASATYAHSGYPTSRPVLRMVRKAGYDTPFSATLRADLTNLPQDPIVTPGTEIAARDAVSSIEVPEQVSSSKIQVSQE